MPAASSSPDSLPSIWTKDRIIALVQRRLKKRPCWYQIEVAKAFFSGRDVIGCAPTGAGKTLSFWIPLLMAQEEGKKKMLFVVSPLNVLAKQNVDALLELGISAVAVSAENATAATFRDIERGKYEVVVTNPEILITNDTLKLFWKTTSFTARILGFIFDEGHCIVQWGKFRKHYLAVGVLRYLIVDPVPFYVASATLPSPIISEISKLLHMNPSTTTQILCSNERPDIALMVRELSYPSSSYKDLSFLIPHNWDEGMNKPKKFLVFFDDIKEAEAAKEFFHQRLLKKYHSKVAWFHSTMSQQYREAKVEEFRKGELWGLFCTDAFGLGMDIGDVEVVVQYKATCDLCTLWQRFGRAARSPAVQGVGILLVEKKNTSHGREKGSKRGSQDSNHGPRKRQRRSKTTHSAIEEEAGDSMDVDSSCQPDTLPSNHAPSQVAWLRECQERYAKPEVAPNDPTNAKKGRLPGVLPGTAMDDYINTPTYVSCRRLVPQLYFGNNKRISDGHRRCDPVAPHGCDRCQPKTKTLCCDICHQRLFEDFCIHDPHLLKTATGVRRSVIPASYKRTALSSTLEDALYKWREDRAVEHFGEGLIRRLGAQVFMTEDILSRILACWACKKIAEISQLHRETSWPEDLIRVHGQSLIDLLATYPSFDGQTIDSIPAPPLLLSPSPLFNKKTPAPMPTPPLMLPEPPAPMPTPPLILPEFPEITYPGPSHIPGVHLLPAPTFFHLPTPLPTPVQTVAAIHTPSTLPAHISTLSPPSPIILSTLVADTPNIDIKASNLLSHTSGLVAPRQRRKRAPIRCGNCLQVGHNQRTCQTSKKVKMELLEQHDPNQENILAASPSSGGILMPAALVSQAPFVPLVFSAWTATTS